MLILYYDFSVALDCIVVELQLLLFYNFIIFLSHLSFLTCVLLGLHVPTSREFIIWQGNKFLGSFIFFGRFKKTLGSSFLES